MDGELHYTCTVPKCIKEKKNPYWLCYLFFQPLLKFPPTSFRCSKSSSASWGLYTVVLFISDYSSLENIFHSCHWCFYGNRWHSFISESYKNYRRYIISISPVPALYSLEDYRFDIYCWQVVTKKNRELDKHSITDEISNKLIIELNLIMDFILQLSKFNPI